MTARYEFKVGPANRNIEYAKPVTVYAEDYSEAITKAVHLIGYEPRNAKTWLQRIEETQ